MFRDECVPSLNTENDVHRHAKALRSEERQFLVLNLYCRAIISFPAFFRSSQPNSTIATADKNKPRSLAIVSHNQTVYHGSHGYTAIVKRDASVDEVLGLITVGRLFSVPFTLSAAVDLESMSDYDEIMLLSLPWESKAFNVEIY